MAAALSLMLGHRTRPSQLACWLLLCSFQARNPLVLDRGAQTLRLALFWTLPLPLGACASLDRRDGRSSAPEALRVASPFTFAMLVQLLLVYLFAGLHKTGGAWWGGDALGDALRIGEITRPLGRWVADLPVLTRAGTAATLVLELLLPWCLLLPLAQPALRTLAWAGFTGLHLGILLLMDLGIFPLHSLAWLLALTPSRLWGAQAPGPPRVESSRPALALALGLAGYVALWNVAGHPDLLVGMAPAARAPGSLLRLDQDWDVFSPDPPRYSSWWVVELVLDDGTRRDLLTGAPPRFERPEDLREVFPNASHWRTLHQLEQPLYRPALPTLAAGYARLARARLPEGRGLRWLGLWWLRQGHGRGGRRPPVQRVLMAGVDASGAPAPRPSR